MMAYWSLLPWYKYYPALVRKKQSQTSKKNHQAIFLAIIWIWHDFQRLLIVRPWFYITKEKAEYSFSIRVQNLAVQSGDPPFLGFVFKRKMLIIFWKQAAKILFLCLEAEQIFCNVITKTLPASKSRGEEFPIISAHETPAKFLRA